MLDNYASALAAAPLSPQTRRTYASKARQYLAWLQGAEADGDPWRARSKEKQKDWAVRHYCSYLQSVLKRRPATVNNALATIDDLYVRRGLGPARALRADIPEAAPRMLSGRAQIRFVRAVQACSSPRDRALALVPFYAGARIAGVVALDLDDARLSARKCVLRIYGKGERAREVPVHAAPRKALATWLDERSGWPGAGGNSALFLNQRGERLGLRGAATSSPASQPRPASMMTPRPMFFGTFFCLTCRVAIRA